MKISRRKFCAQLGGLALGATLLAGCSIGSSTTSKTFSMQANEFKYNLVTGSNTDFKDRKTLAIELLPDVQKGMLVPNAVTNGPSFAIADVSLANGTIEVDLAARINGKGAPDVRGFVGIAFHIDDKNETFEAVYLRMTNGSKNNPAPPAPRNVYAVQYISYPDRYWRKLREEFPNKYEKAAPVAIESWHKLHLDIQGDTVTASVDGEKVLVVNDVRFPNRKGKVGLWIDDGTTGYFANLKVTPR